MNYTLDLINSWAERLTYRLMKMSGVSEETLQKYVKSIVDRDSAAVQADADLAKSVNWAEYLKYGLVIVVLFLVFRIYKLYKSK